MQEAPLATLDRLVRASLAPAISGVHTLPLHPSSSDGGFSVIDHAVVDPAFGTWADVDRLAADVTWMADAVVNHTSAQGTWFRSFLDGHPVYADFFARLPKDVDTSAVVRPRTSPLAHEFTAADGRVERIWTTFSADQVDLDVGNPHVLLAIVDVVLRYVRHGAQAIRLDAIAFVWKDPATASINLPGAHAVVGVLRACLDEVAPGVVLVTETNVPHAENVAYFGSASTPEAHAVYQFALPPLVAHAALSGSTRRLTEWLRHLDAPPAGHTYLNFLASHDGIGLRPAEGILGGADIELLVAVTVAGGGQVNSRSVGAATRPYELATTWRSLLAHGVDDDEALARHVATHALMLALQGVPLLYLGALAGDTNDVDGFDRTGHARDLNRRRFTFDALVAQLESPSGAWSRIRNALTTRASSPAFHPASPQRVLDAPDGCVLVERGPFGGHHAVVAVNLTSAPATVPLPAGEQVALAPWQSSWHLT